MMSNKLGTIGALALATVAMVCGTALMIAGKLDADSAWPALLAAVIVPSIGILLGQQLHTQSSAIGDVQSKVNGRMTELIGLVAALSDRLGVDPDLTHPENQAALADVRSGTLTAALPTIPATRAGFTPSQVAAAAPVDPTDDGGPIPPDGPTD